MKVDCFWLGEQVPAQEAFQIFTPMSAICWNCRACLAGIIEEFEEKGGERDGSHHRRGNLHFVREENEGCSS